MVIDASFNNAYSRCRMVLQSSPPSLKNDFGIGQEDGSNIDYPSLSPNGAITA